MFRFKLNVQKIKVRSSLLNPYILDALYLNWVSFEDKRRRGWQRMRWLQSITDPMDMHLSKFWEIVKDRGAWRAAVHEVTKSQTGLSNRTTTINLNWVKRQERRQAKGGEERKKWIKKEQITIQLIQQILSLLSPLWPIGFSLRCKFPHCSWETLQADAACWFWPQLCLMKFLSNEDHHGSVGSHRSFHSFQKQPHSHLTLRTLH